MTQAEPTSPRPDAPASGVPMVGPIRSVPSAVLASLAWLVVLGVQLVIEPRFEQYFTDFGVALPRVTVFAVESAHWLQGQGASFPMWPAAVLTLAATIGVLAAVGASRRGPRILLWLLFALGVVLLVMLAVAFGLPMLAVQQSLEASGGVGAL